MTEVDKEPEFDVAAQTALGMVLLFVIFVCMFGLGLFLPDGHGIAVDIAEVVLMLLTTYYLVRNSK